MNKSAILDRLPYSRPFLFVDELLEVNEQGLKGSFTFSNDLDFYRGHFKEHPVTPGVILTECCAQIGLVCLGIFLLGNDGNPGHSRLSREKHGSNEHFKIALSSSEMEFLLPVYPDEKVTVTSQKRYFRFNKLKCGVKMHNSAGELICKGEMAGMIKLENSH